MNFASWKNGGLMILVPGSEWLRTVSITFIQKSRVQRKRSAVPGVTKVIDPFTPRHPMSDDTPIPTRRALLKLIGLAAGSGAMLNAMATLGHARQRL